MRLTLRTLLAYLDNILEPSAMQAMTKKIEESPAAAELVHRIRDVTKKVRLAAPNLDGKGLGLDPNTVAEYLDNTLAGERTPDFEMVCLESDVHLAEVAACHEILSLVLVKPAEIDPTSRQKMYDVINQRPAATTKPTEAPAPTATPVATAVASPVAEQASRPREVPDYLRGAAEPSAAQVRRGWQAAVVAAVVLLLVGGAAVLALVQPDRLPGFLQPLSRLLHPQSLTAQNEPTEPAVRPLPAVEPEATPPATPPAEPELRQPDSVTTPTPDAPPAATTTATSAPSGAGELRQPAAAAATSANTAPSASPKTAAPPPVAVATSTVAAPATPTGTAAPPSVAPPAATAPAVAPAAAKIEPVGRVSSPVSQVILRFNAAQNAWTRLPAREQLMVGDRLLTLPDYRSQLALADGLTIDMLGGTLVELTPIDAAGTPGLKLLRGRLLLFTVGGAKAALRLDNGRTPTTFTLSSAELGLEFVRQRAPGDDPAKDDPWIVRLYAHSGQTSWSSGGGAETPLPAPATAVLAAEGPPVAAAAAAELPKWLTQDERDLLQKQAADAIEAKLRGDKAVSVALREVLDDRPPRTENVQLALRCLAQIGEFADFMPLLRDATQRYSTWDRYVQMLVEAIDFGPDYAAAVQKIFTTQHGPEGETEYRMLWGYSDDQLKAGAAQFLVESLNHPELDVRVLAYWTLGDVTGLTISYLPQDPETKRKPNIQKWQAKLEAGQIVRKQAP